MSSGNDFATWRARRERRGAVLSDGSTSVLAENDLLGSTVDPDDFEAFRAREAASERGRQIIRDSKKKSVWDGGYDTWGDVLRAPVQRSLMPGGGIATSPNDPLALQLVAGFFDDALTPAGAATTVLPGYKGGGISGQLLRGLGRGGSAAYGVSGSEKMLDSDRGTGERVLGGVEALLGALGAFAPGPHVDPAPRPSSRAQGRFEPWPPKPADRLALPASTDGQAFNPRALTGDVIIDGEILGEFPPDGPGGLPPGGSAPRALYPASLPEHGPINLGPPPTALERPDLLSDKDLYEQFIASVRANKFDDLAVYEAEVARRGEAGRFTPQAEAVPDAGLPQRPGASIFEDPEVAAELSRLRARAGQISTRTMPQPIDVPIEQRTIRRAPAPEFEPVQPLDDVPRGTSPLEVVPDSTGDDIVDALLDPQELAYQTVLRKYRAGEQLTNSHMNVLDDMAGVRDAKAARAGILEPEVEDVIGAAPASAGPDVRDLRSQSASTPPRGVQPGGGALDRPVGGPPRRIATEDAPRFAELAAEARAAGYTGSDADLEQLFLDELDKARDYDREFARLDLEEGPTSILRHVSELGGISLGAETGGPMSRAAGLIGNRGELKALYEQMDYGTRPGGFNKRTGGVNATKRLPKAGLDGIGTIVHQLRGGKSLDGMAEALRERGINIEDPNQLLDEIEKALVAHRKGAVSPNVYKTLEEGLGVRVGNRWWDKKGNAAVDEALDVSPQQARTVVDDAIEPAGDVDTSFTPHDYENELLGPIANRNPLEGPYAYEKRLREAGARQPVDPDEIIDELLTGEKQARLPGAGQVRAAEIATPEVAEVPFSLEREAATRGSVQEGMRFDAPDEADSLIDEALEVPTFEQLPGNVRSFLTQRLGYSPDEINAMTPEQAIATGRARTPSPNRPQAAGTTPELTQAGVLARQKVRAAKAQAGEERRISALNEFAENELPKREALAEARSQPKQGPVAPMRFGDKRPAGDVERLKAQDREIRAEMAADRAEAERIKAMSPSERQSRAAQMASDDRGIAAKIKRLMEDPDPTPEKFDEMKALYEQQAEQFAKRQLKGGTGKEMSNDELYSFLTNNIGSMGPLAALNPKIFRELVTRWYASPVIRSMFGGFAGAAIDDESEFRGFVYGAAAAAATPSGLRALARAARLAKQGKVPWPVDPRDSGKDISWARLLLPFSPEGTVPELFRDVTEQLTRLQQVYENPAFDDNARAAIMKSAKPAIAQMMRTAADEAKAKGLKRKAFYANKLADAYESKLTAGQRAVKNAGEAAGLNLKGNEIERKIGGNVYRVLVGYALDTAAQNLTQPVMTMLYVSPRSLVKAYKVSRTAAARALAKRFDAELPEVPELADEDLLETVRRTPSPDQGVKKHSPMKLLHVTDNYNRRVALIAGLEEAGVLDEALSGKLDLVDPRAQRAMSIMRKTQGHFGAMGNNPLYRGPVMGTIKPFTKYPFMFVERMLDAFQDPDAKGLQYVATLLGAAMAGKTIGVDLEDLLLGGGRPLGLDLTDPEETASNIISGKAFPATRAIGDALSHATGNADHSMFEDLPNLAVGRYPMKVADKVKNHLAVHGTGEHKSAGGTAPEHDGYDDILSLLGLQTAARGEKLKARDEAYEFNKFAKRERDEKYRSLREEYRKASERGDRAKMRALEQQMSEGQRRSLRRSTQQKPYERLREQTPREDRKEFDRRFRDRLEDK